MRPPRPTSLAIGVTLFVIPGAFHVLIGILTALLFDPTAGRFLFLSRATDAALYGADARAVLLADPALVQLSTMVIALAGVLVGLGIAELALAWFGVGQGQVWALAALIAAWIAMLPFWMLVLRPYLAAGVRSASAMSHRSSRSRRCACFRRRSQAPLGCHGATPWATRTLSPAAAFVRYLSGSFGKRQTAAGSAREVVA